MLQWVTIGTLELTVGCLNHTTFNQRWLTLSTQALFLTVDFMIHSHWLAAGAVFFELGRAAAVRFH